MVFQGWKHLSRNSTPFFLFWKAPCAKLFSFIHFCPSISIFLPWVWSLFCSWIQAKNLSTHSCQAWHPYWPAGSRWVSSLGWISMPCKSYRLQNSAWPLLIIWFCLVSLFVSASAKLSLLVAPGFRLAQLLEPRRTLSAVPLHFVELPLPQHHNFSIIPLPLLLAWVELGGIVPKLGNVQLSVQGGLQTLEVENINMNPQDWRGECFCMVVVFA